MVVARVLRRQVDGLQEDREQEQHGDARDCVCQRCRSGIIGAARDERLLRGVGLQPVAGWQRSSEVRWQRRRGAAC